MGNQAVVLGLGNFLSGDFGVGGYVIEALGQECDQPQVDYVFLGQEAWRTGLYTLEKQLVCIVHACSHTTFPPGAVLVLDLPGYRRMCRQSAHSALLGETILDSLAKTSLVADETAAYRFVLVAAGHASGLSLSPPVRRSVRKAVQRIKQLLTSAGCFPTPSPKISRMYRLDLLSTTI